MPLYEYACRGCGRQFEMIRSMNDADKIIECTYCKSKDTRRVLSVFFAHSSGKSLADSGSGCGSCSGGNCGSCNH